MNIIKLKRTVQCCALLLLFTGCNSQKEPVSPSAILISDVTVIDMKDGSLHESQQVVVDSGKIVSVSGSVNDAEEYNQRIDGRGKFLLPGLAEMHAHIPSPPTTRERQEETLFLYLSNGITTIRGMLGHPSHLDLREKVLGGEVLSPRIFTSSPSLNGNSVGSTQAADSLVKKYAADGYDFLKIHPGIPLEPFDTLVSTARKVNISFAGHVPVDVGIRHALESGYASIDHVDGFLEGLVPENAGVKPNENGFFGYNFTPLTDTVMVDELVTLSRENEVWIVPTQSLFERWFAPVDTENLLNQPEMQYMPATTLNNWRQTKLETTGPDTGFKKENWEQFIAIRRQLIKALQENGYGIVLGSDAPQLFNVPGFSIHHEIAAMEKAGLTPLQIIQSGTINPARYFGMEDTFGLVKTGLDADLILLDSNPLEDLGALKKLSGVMVRGNWLDKETIDVKLAEIAEHARSQ